MQSDEMFPHPRGREKGEQIEEEGTIDRRRRRRRRRKEGAKKEGRIRTREGRRENAVPSPPLS